MPSENNISFGEKLWQVLIAQILAALKSFLVNGKKAEVRSLENGEKFVLPSGLQLDCYNTGRVTPRSSAGKEAEIEEIKSFNETLFKS